MSSPKRAQKGSRARAPHLVSAVTLLSLTEQRCCL